MGYTIVRRDDNRLVAAFTGRLVAAEGTRSAAEFAQAMGMHNMHCVFDIREMAGYESVSRQAWQTMLFPLRKQVLSLTIVGGNAFVKLGAITLASILGIPYRFSETL